jgi:hypothetical protein
MNRIAASLIAAGLMGIAGATPVAAKPTAPLKADVLGSFFFHECPADAPVGALCLHDDVTGNLTHLGRTTGRFEVVFDVAQFGEDGCGPIRKTGTFTAANGDQLSVDAQGSFCFGTVVAIYTYNIIGGTGRFAGASGSGSWVVPPPINFDGVAGVGDEFLLGGLVK